MNPLPSNLSPGHVFTPATFEPNTEGIWLDMPYHIYRAAPGVNVSSLKPLAESPLKYRHAQDNPQKATAAMNFGTIIHALTLEPGTAHEAFVTRPPQWDSFRTKEARAWRDAQTLIILSEEDLAGATAAAHALQAEPNTAWILARAGKEVAVFKRHDRTGLLLKARLDLPFMDRDETMAIADIKKVQTASEYVFKKAMRDRLYGMAGAFYLDLLGASAFYFILVEEDAPHEIAIFQQSPRSIVCGRARYEALLDLLVTCRASNEWPSRFEMVPNIPSIEEEEWFLTRLGV